MTDYAQIRADLDTARADAQTAYNRWETLHRNARTAAYQHAGLPDIHARLQCAATVIDEYESRMCPGPGGTFADHLAQMAGQIGARLTEAGLEPVQTDTATTPRSAGQIGYEAYGQHAGWRTFDGRPMPAWHDLGVRVQWLWQAAANAITADHEGGDA